MKTKEEKKKSNLWFMLFVLLLISVILCISSFGIATWARYRSITGGNVEAQIAKWSFKVNGEEEQFADINLADTIDFTHVTTDKIAPGTYGSFDLDIDGRGSEVSLDYYININVINKPTNLKFYSDAGYTIPISVTMDNKVYLNGDFLLTEQSMQEIRTIYWKWDYRTQNLPSESILQGYYSSIEGLELLVNEYNAGTEQQKQELALKINDKIDTYEAGREVLLEVSVKGIQINPEFSLKGARILSPTDQSYSVGDIVNLELEFTENVYADNNQTVIDETNAPEVIVGFEASANNPIAKIASLMDVNIKISLGNKNATFVRVEGNKIIYEYMLTYGDNGQLKITNIVGSVYNKDGKQINFSLNDIPKIIGGNIQSKIEPIVEVDSTVVGQYVDIGTNILNLNSITLSDGTHPKADWRVFKNDDDGGVWLILSDFLPGTKLPANTGLKVCTSPYCINGSSRSIMVSGFSKKTQWKELIKGTTCYSREDVIVKGAFTLEEWVASWNLNPNYTHLNGKEQSASFRLWYDNGNGTDNVSSNGGYNNSLYFTHKAQVSNCWGYWLSSDNASGVGNIVKIRCSGHVYCNDYNANTYYGVRPGVYIPPSMKLDTSGDVWTIQNN